MVDQVKVSIGSQTDGVQPVLLNGERVGHIRKPEFGKGYFLELDGVTWNNAPGARWVQDSGGGAKATYAKTIKELVRRAEEHYTALAAK